MERSETISNLAAALVAAQAELEAASKDSQNPHFRSAYASLSEVIDTVRPALNRHGIVILQAPGWGEGGLLSLETTLLHTSGEYLSSTAYSPLSKADPQGVGSAITYLRRYTLSALTCLSQADDDGNAASGNRPSNVVHPVMEAGRATGSGDTGRNPAPAAPTATGWKAEFSCPKCGKVMKLIPAGTSKTSGKKYGAFFACPKPPDGCGHTLRESEVNSAPAPEPKPVQRELSADEIPF